MDGMPSCSSTVLSTDEAGSSLRVPMGDMPVFGRERKMESRRLGVDDDDSDDTR